MKLHTLNRITLLSTLLAVGAFCLNLHAAGWGSLHGNNRSAPMQSAPRPQPQMNRAPQPQVHVSEQHQEIQPAREQPHPVEHFQPAPEQVDRARAGETDRRRMDIDADRRQSFFWSDYHAGMRIDRLPDGYRSIGVHGHTCFYYEGVFYDDGPSGYVCIAPPVDADVPDLPPGAETVEVNGMIYYYAAGTFYVQQPDGSYIVVPAPLGVTVAELPPDAVSVVINGTGYYQADGAFYLPVMQNGVTAYLTVQQP
jgi:hypothetical protein